MNLRLRAGGPGDPATKVEETRRAGRTPRDWIVDALFFLLGAGFTLLALYDAVERQLPTAMTAVEAALGGLASLGLWWRRSRPIGFAVVAGLFGVYSVSASGVALIALFTVAVHRRPRTAVLVAVGYAMTSFLTLLVRPDASPPNWHQGVLGVVCVLGILAWGMFIRSRRQLHSAARDRAASEEELRDVRARQSERNRIAPEMHDVLAHRLSLLSLQAGALELVPDAPPAEIAHTAGMIRVSAHGALEDLREVIGMLRGPSADGDVPERPQPTLTDLPTLIEDSRRAGMRVILDCEMTELSAVPEALGRTVFRIIQEGLTNARKHAGAEAVSVAVRGAASDGLTVEIRNPTPGAPDAAAPIPGAGTGLIGLAERTALIGGRLEHGPTPSGEFRLRARLPWLT